MSRLNGKVLITGGGSGIEFGDGSIEAAEGAKVAITGRNETKLKEAAASLQERRTGSWPSRPI